MSPLEHLLWEIFLKLLLYVQVIATCYIQNIFVGSGMEKIKTNTKGQRGTFGGDKYVYYLDCGDDNMWIHISKITKLCKLIMCS